MQTDDCRCRLCDVITHNVKVKLDPEHIEAKVVEIMCPYGRCKGIIKENVSYSGCNVECNYCGSTLRGLTPSGRFLLWLCPNGHRVESGVAYCAVKHCKSNEFWHKPKTQKAKGVLALGECEVSIPHYRGCDTMLVVPVAGDLKGDTYTWIKFPCFARPCPMVAEHGFVESRMVNGPGELEALRREVEAVSPVAEIVLMGFINASHNAIITPDLITVGPGNDGATSGENAVEVPIVHFEGIGFSERVLRKAGIEHEPYLEAVKVRGSNIWTGTQLRDGPGVSYCEDYIPERVRVKAVIRLDRKYDLMDWKKVLDSAPAGTVVHNVSNFGMGSHYGVHCVLNRIPFIKSFTPIEGMTIEPTSKSVELSREGILEGLILGFTIQRNGFRWDEMGIFSLAALHNVAVFGPAQSRFVGFGIAVALRLGLMALYGESRHAIAADHGGRSLPDRDYVYEASWEHLKDSLAGLDDLKERWRQDWGGGSFGGKRWLECHESLENLLDATLVLVRSRNTWARRVVELIEAYNTMINTAHNGGKWFNKFFSVRMMDKASESPGMIAASVAHVFYEVAKLAPPRITLKEAMNTNLNSNSVTMRPWEFGERHDESCSCSSCENADKGDDGDDDDPECRCESCKRSRKG